MGGVDSLKGRLLVASPSLEDPNFRRSVVLVAEHTDEGALGVVLNRPADTQVDEAAPELEALGVEGALHVGGPVQPTSIVVLAEFADPDAAAVLATGRVGLLSAEADMDAVPDKVDRARAFAGYAGWGPGQLDAEVEREDWIVTDVRPDDPFTDEPEGLWRAVLARRGGRFALLSTMPDDPSLN